MIQGAGTTGTSSGKQAPGAVEARSKTGAWGLPPPTQVMTDGAAPGGARKGGRGPVVHPVDSEDTATTTTTIEAPGALPTEMSDGSSSDSDGAGWEHAGIPARRVGGGAGTHHSVGTVLDPELPADTQAGKEAHALPSLSLLDLSPVPEARAAHVSSASRDSAEAEPAEPSGDSAEQKRLEKEKRRQEFLALNPHLARTSFGRKGGKKDAAQGSPAGRLVAPPTVEMSGASLGAHNRSHRTLIRPESFRSDRSGHSIAASSRAISPANTAYGGARSPPLTGLDHYGRPVGLAGDMYLDERLADMKVFIALGGGSAKERKFPPSNTPLSTVTTRLYFDHCVVNRAQFKDVTFQEKVQFVSCEIDAPLFVNCTFTKGLRFDNCLIQRSTANLKMTFRDCKFEQKVEMRTCQVDCNTDFTRCGLLEGLDGWDSKFLGWVEFEDCVVDKNLDFRSGKFREGLVFASTEFRGDIVFRGTIVLRKVEFEACRLSGLLDLRKAKFQDFVYLQGLDFEGGSSIRLWNCTSTNILVEPRQLHKRLASERDRDWTIAAEEYAILKKNFQSQGWLDEEDWSYYCFKKSRWRAQGNLTGLSIGSKIRRQWSRLVEYFIYDLACGYGTKPVQVVSFSLSVICVFAVIFCIPLLFTGPPTGYDLDVHYYLPVYELFGSVVPDYIATAFITSAATYRIGYNGVDKQIEGWMAFALLVEALCGYLMLGLCFVSFSRKIIR